MPRVSDEMYPADAPKASDMVEKKTPRELYLDYAVEQQSNGKPAVQFKEWYELHQKGKI